MIGRVIISVALGFGLLCISTVSAKACGFAYGSVGFPAGWECGCPGFFLMGPPLGLGPGYPGLRPPFPAFAYPAIYPPVPETPPVAVYTIVPGNRFRSEQPEEPSPPATSTMQSAIGRDFRRPAPPPAPSLDEELAGSSQFNIYIARRCYQGGCHEIDPSVALSPDPQPGIIFWTPRN